MSRRFLNGLVTLPGRHTVDQAELAVRLREQIEDLPDARSAAQMVGFVYEHSTIEQRHVEMAPDETRDDGWYLRVNRATEAMSRRALSDLFALGISPGDIDGFVAVTTSYAGFPSLTRRLQQSIGISMDAVCYDVTGLGCAGPTHGLQLADLLIDRGAANNVCLLCVDAMATHGELRRHASPPTMSQLVAHCLASDGAAALVVGRSQTESTLLSWTGSTLTSRLWADALDENDFTASTDNEPYLSVGKEIRTRLLDELRPFLNEAVDGPALFHPGGAALMRILSESYPSLAGTLALSSDVLRGNGNIGSASLLWVLDRALRSSTRLTPLLRLIALGPGIVSTILRLDGVERGYS